MVWGIDFGIHNFINCKGWDTAASTMGPVSFDFGSPCMMAKLGFVLLFFLTALIRKWGAEEWGIPFSFLWALIGGMASYAIVVIFTGSFKLSFLIGFIVMILCGYLLGYMSEGSSEPNYG